MPTAVNSFGKVVNISGNTLAQTMAFISNLLTTYTGVTIYDQVSATSTVFKYQASARSIPVYFQITVTSTSVITIGAFYRYWSATTHTGGTMVGESLTLSTASGYVYLVACPGVFHMSTCTAGIVDATTTWGFFFSAAPYNFPTLPGALLTAPASAGNGVVVAVDNVTGFAAGMKIAIGDPANGWDVTTIISVGASSLTLTKLTIGLSAGAIICVSPTFVFNTFSSVARPSLLLFCDESLIAASKLSYLLATAVPKTLFNMAASGVDGTTGKTNTAPLLLQSPAFSNAILDVDALIGVYTAGTLNNFLVYNADGSPVSSGTATSGTTTTLVNSAATWATNALVGKYVAIAGGTNAGMCRKITANDATSITVDEAFPSAINTSSQYTISDHVYRYGLSQNLTLLPREKW